MSLATLLRIVTLFGSLSLVSFGGRNSVLPEMRREAVVEDGWMTDRQFADLFAISEAAPGPSSLMVALVGLKAGGVTGIGGILGALAAVLAMIAPACVVTSWATRGWDRFRGSPWRVAAERGLGAVTLGLVAASVVTIAEAGDHGIAAWAVSVATAVLVLATDVSPLFLMAAGALLGVLGIV
ncbi:MAG TPA: chromate transporter [Candidatus Binatia bacterium]|nr:chromate transporter [Candidatus Binatia bacterium]